MNRREFLKLSGFVGTALIGGVNINEADPYNLWKPIPLNRLEKTKTTCSLCKNFCTLVVYKRKELIFSLEPDDKNVICPKVLAYHNVIYNRERIKTPLLRNGKKGEFKFKVLDYQKALEILKEKIREGLFIDAFANGEIEKYYLNQISSRINFYPDHRYKEILGADYVYFDLEKADLILNFGSDLILDNMFYPYAKNISKNAKKIINFTPLITNDTFLGSQWYPAKIEDLGNIANRIINGLKGQTIDKDIQPIIENIKSSKNICVVFSQNITETVEGINSLSQIMALARFVNGINKEGGIYFYRHEYGSKPFNLITENIKNYAVYNIDPFFIYVSDNFRKKLESIPFTIYFGNEITEITRFADLIIPIPYFFERNDLYIKKTSSGFDLSLSNHAISGGVEAIDMRDKANIELLFQKIFNFKAPYGIKDISEIVKGENNKLLDKNSLISSLKTKNPYNQVIPYNIEPVSFQGTKLGIYLYNDSVVSFKTRGSKWAEEMGNSNPLLINPKTASRYGLRNRQKVLIRTKDNVISTKVFVYDGIAEDVIALKRFKIKMLGNTYQKADKKLLSKDKEEKEIWWNNEDVELERLFVNENYKNLFVMKQNSIEISKG